MLNLNKNSKETKKHFHRVATLSIAASISSVAVMGSGMAWAAGSGYGPPVVVTKGVAQGFGGILTAVTIPSTGKTIHIKEHGANLYLHMGGCNNKNFQVIVTKSSIGTNSNLHYQGVPKSVIHKDVIYTLGVLIQSGTKEVTSCKIDTLDIYGQQFIEKDYVLYYRSKPSAFGPAPKYHSSVSKHHLIAKFRSDTEIVVVGPKASNKPSPQKKSSKSGKK